MTPELPYAKGRAIFGSRNRLKKEVLKFPIILLEYFSLIFKGTLCGEI